MQKKSGDFTMHYAITREIRPRARLRAQKFEMLKMTWNVLSFDP